MLSRLNSKLRPISSTAKTNSSGINSEFNTLTPRPKNTQLEQHVTKNAERELYKYNNPTQEMGMTDLIKRHTSGERFLYAALTANQEEEDSSRLRRLLNFQPKLNREFQALDELPHLELFHETETFSLSDAIIGRQKQSRTQMSQPAVKLSKPRKYILIKEVSYLYGSLVSTDSEFSKLQICLVDDRMLNSKVVKKIITNTNVMNSGIINLDYSFPEDEIDKMSLSVTRESQFLEEGSQWGVIQIKIQYQKLSFPVQTSNSQILAVNRLPQSMLEERSTNPNIIDVSTLENDRCILREMYMNGDITNEAQPLIEKSEAVKYSKSSLAGPRGVKPDVPRTSDWAFVNDNRVKIAQGANSEDPSEDDSSDKSFITPSKELRPAIKSANPSGVSSQDYSFQPRRVIFDEIQDDDSPMATYRH